jgi:hypothetical protein
VILEYIFNLSISQGVYPSGLKIVRVIPLFKFGDSTLIENHKPISLLSTLNKIFEKILYKRIFGFLNSVDFFMKTQFGFRPKCSPSTAILEIRNFINSRLNESEYVAGEFLDLQKAFDTINHGFFVQIGLNRF